MCVCNLKEEPTLVVRCGLTAGDLVGRVGRSAVTPFLENDGTPHLVSTCPGCARSPPPPAPLPAKKVATVAPLSGWLCVWASHPSAQVLDPPPWLWAQLCSPSLESLHVPEHHTRGRRGGREFERVAVSPQLSVATQIVLSGTCAMWAHACSGVSRAFPMYGLTQGFGGGEEEATPSQFETPS